ncbi:MAG TPA: tetratricopeptide repeat protein [Polyangiaceae bacterium]|jgi:tetratricopeptide (TPR) repeat protein
MIRRLAAAALAVALWSPCGHALADTPPSVWDIARDPSALSRWTLHVRAQQLLHGGLIDEATVEGGTTTAGLALAAARAELEEAGAASSSDVRLRFDLGIVYERLASIEEREDLYEAAARVLAPALAMAPDHPAATRAFEALTAVYDRLDRPADEVDTTRRYIDRIEDGRLRATGMMNMGEAEMRLGRVDDALGTFRAVLQICATTPGTIMTYALTLWDLSVALDRDGDARSALDTALKARQVSWEVEGPQGHPRRVTGWDAIRDYEEVFFVPEWEREWYLALGDAAAARDEKDPRAGAGLWEDAERHWGVYADRAAAAHEARWLAIARARRDHAHVERGRAASLASRLPPAKNDRGSGADHAL